MENGIINVIEDMSMPVVGLERRAYMCSACGTNEQRTAINEQAREKQKEEVSAIVYPRPIVPTVNVDNQRAAQSFLGRMLAGMRRR